MPNPQSPLHVALSKVGDRWTLQVIDSLLAGPRRFGDLQDDVAGIAPNTLSSRLKALEGEGLVIARSYSERPPRFEYTLTASGKELAGAISLLAAWGSGHSDEAEVPRHGLCGTPLEVRWYCPTCDREATQSEEAWDI
ncbi:MAG: helix-turn-helix domain-containing protein [Actinomycetota bacterium]|nr:helix-turn-helix domain-containing protein [Actinomycetota bacterium]